MTESIEVDHEATLAAVRREAEMWRTAKDRLAEQLNARDADIVILREEIVALQVERDQLAERVSEDDDIIAERADEVVARTAALETMIGERDTWHKVARDEGHRVEGLHAAALDQLADRLVVEAGFRELLAAWLSIANFAETDYTIREVAEAAAPLADRARAFLASHPTPEGEK